MKVALIGTHGVGKTFLCNQLFNYLSQKGFKVKVLEESARKCPFDVNEKSTYKAQLWILLNQIQQELSVDSKEFNFVFCDRSVLDNYACMVRVAGERKELNELIDFWLKSYDIIFKLPFTSRYLQGDGFRATGIEFQQEIEHILLKLLKEKNIKFTDLPKNNQVEFIEKQLI